MLNPQMKEQTRHGEPLFPLMRYITRILDTGTPFMPHWHEEAELTLIRSGSCTYQIELATYEVSAGDILLIPPEVLHSIHPLKEISASKEISALPGALINSSQEPSMISETYVFGLSYLGNQASDVCNIRYLTPFCNHTLVLPYLIHSDHPRYSELKALFEKISSSFSAKNPGYEICLKAYLLEFFAMLLPYSDNRGLPTATQNEHIQKLKTVFSYIEQHLEEPITVQTLSQICYFSQYHFMRFFKKSTGMSCIAYIKKARLTRAAFLIKNGKSPLEASLSVGFTNLSYFYREFKKYYGITPKEFSSL